MGCNGCKGTMVTNPMCPMYIFSEKDRDTIDLSKCDYNTTRPCCSVTCVVDKSKIAERLTESLT